MSASLRPLDYFASLDTPSNAVQGILEVPTTNNSSASVIVVIIVRRKSDGASQGWTFQGAYRNVSGVLTITNTLIGTIQGSSADKTALTSCAITATANSAALRISVQGLSATALMWAASLQGMELFDQ